MDDFGIKCTSKRDADHLINALRDFYKVSVDWKGDLYCGIQLKWCYTGRRHVDLSVPDYIRKALHELQHKKPARRQDAPHRHNKPTFGATKQKPTPEDATALLPPPRKKYIEKTMGKLLFYSRAIDSTLRTAISSISSCQSKPTETTWDDTQRLLDYCYSHPDATIRFYASDMILKIHSDASYLSEPKARSRVGGHFYLGNLQEPDINNGAIHTVCGILKHVTSSATEAEFGGLFVNCKEAVPIRQMLEDMRHPQPTDGTPVTTDNSTAEGIANSTMKQSRSKAMDMRFYWAQDRVSQKQFRVFWRRGKLNMGDYHTKHHSPGHNRKMRPCYLHMKDSPVYLPHDSVTGSTVASPLRGCIDPAFSNPRAARPRRQHRVTMQEHSSRLPARRQ